ncbi:hypothetical protein RND81_05G134500 [Saponaria officinalis]|uniref:ATPase AAA-type core domain-containing protein n=1 Tax=Saponaria officinalis TaxID=3572 RepID=A0AAW1KY56_SAPOF
MHKVSDGQRRRVQICMGLLKPFKVLLLDEITVDLDVLARADLLSFLKKECDERHATIIYATHIFEGLESWPSHIVYLANGRLQLSMPMDQVKELSKMLLMLNEKTETTLKLAEANTDSFAQRAEVYYKGVLIR